MPGVHRRRRAREADRLCRRADLAGVALVDAEQDAGDLGPPGADEAGEADDLAGADREARCPRNSPARVRPSTSSSTSPTGVSTFGNSDTVRPTMCRTRSAVVRSRVGVVTTWRPSRKTVARSQSSKTSSSRWLTKRTATPRSRSRRTIAEQALDLVGRQRRGRLVEDQDARVDRQRLGDLDELLVGHRQAADRRADVELDVELLEQRLRRPARRAPVDRPEPRRTARGR